MTDLVPVPAAPPPVSDEQASDLAREVFGIVASARSLGSHQDRNFLLQGASGRALLKIANPGTSAAELLLQSRAADHLADREPGLRAPRTRPALDGSTVPAVRLDGQALHVRLLDFVEGEPLSGPGYLGPRAVRALGELAGRVDLALADFRADGVERPHQWDLRQAPEVLATLLPHVEDADLRDRLDTVAARAWARLEPLTADLPVQVVHGDLTGDNVVAPAGTGRVPDGVIDFGDLNRSWAVAEVAITLSSVLQHAGGSAVTAMRALAGYHAVRPLTPLEAEALWPLVVLRAATLVASAHHVRATDPENAYAADNFALEQLVFERATELPPVVATALVRDTVGARIPVGRLPVSGSLIRGLDAAAVRMLDLSAASADLHDGRWTQTGVEADLAATALRAGAAGALTRYGQSRLTRSTPRHGDEPRNTALGVDLTLRQSHDVVAPWPGTVTVHPDRTTLVGAGVRLHLRGLADGPAADRVVAAGDVLGRVEGRLEIRAQVDDPEGPDVPRFTTAALARAWSAVAIDPSPLVLDPVPAPEPSPSSTDLLERRARRLAAVQEHYFDEPPVMVRGWQEHLVDADGRVYLDMLNNVTSIGHAHPRLVEAVAEQTRRLNTNSRFLYPAAVELAERLADLLPAGLDSVFLVNSGTEAVDLALRISRAWSGRREVLAVREAYHGWSELADAVSTSIADNPDALTTRPDWVHTVDAPNTYRGRYRGPGAGRYAEDAVAAVRALAEAGTPVGTFIAEPYYGNAGGLELPAGYLAAIVPAVHAAGGLFVADEVQVGYGRLGDWFWGFEQQAVVPDIVAVAKAMGNGHPLGAVVTSTEIAERYRSQGYFFSSAGGSPVSSVVGTTVLDIIRDERLQQNAAQVGARLKAGLIALADRHRLIGAVHGHGLYLGVEFVRDHETLEPATEETAAICERLRELGVIMQPTSDRQCVLKIKPPLCLTAESADFFVRALDEVLSTGW